jgi:hypothetical protein
MRVRQEAQAVSKRSIMSMAWVMAAQSWRATEATNQKLRTVISATFGMPRC